MPSRLTSLRLALNVQLSLCRYVLASRRLVVSSGLLGFFFLLTIELVFNQWFYYGFYSIF
jgi:hypothetical protein